MALLSRRLKDLYFDFPVLDWFPSVLVGAGVYAWNLSFQLESVESRVALFGGVATIAGLVLAAATFVAAMTYQSSNILMTRVRDMYSSTLSKNWTTIIRSALLTAPAALALLLVDSSAGRVAVAAALGLLALVTFRGLRALAWLMLTLFAEESSSKVPDEVPTPFPKKTSLDA